MRTIDVDDELYHYIASNTRQIGESAAQILRRLLNFPQPLTADLQPVAATVTPSSLVDAVIAALATGGRQRQRFLNAMSVLAVAHPVDFATLVSLRGRSRRYFALSADELLASGASTRPAQIPASRFFVVTNTNGAAKARLLDKAMLCCGLSANERQQVLAKAAFTLVEER